ncbi:TetR/AcrR family transcriptional regulator [Tindallia californiensis]|uniref:TetR/AcrR family transcriptional regulator n=1 Tax=Tindallia californiensis TaxID=159292 RepID=UPI00241FEA62|nr:TetR/AcrR family transcriptional regulator [Tindallia californiensis]
MKAAARIVYQKGVFALTLDAVAQEAEISKGGLLHYFKSKEALVKAMVEYTSESYREGVEQRVAHEELEKGMWTRSLIAETFEQAYDEEELNASFLMAVAMKPELLEPIKNAYKHWQQKIEKDGLDPIEASILRLAIDGLWMNKLMGLYQFDESLLHHVYERMIQKTMMMKPAIEEKKEEETKDE